MSAGLYGSSSVPNSALASLLPTSPAPPSGEGAEAGGGAAWLQMAASQLAVQDYLSRVQAAAREPAQLAALQAGAAGLIPGYEQLLSGNKVNGNSGGRGKKNKTGAVNILDNLKLPSDTEIVKSVHGSGVNTVKNKVVDSRSENSGVSIPNIPPGLTIERKKPGRKPLDPNYHIPSSGQVIDKVEITKIPMSNGSSSPAPLDMTKSRVTEDDAAGDAPLNLSMKADTSASDNCEPPALTIKRKSSSDRESSGGKIPSDYYACK